MGRTEREGRRLLRQAAAHAAPTRRLLAAAGIGPGMTVLDLGSGAGDVALLAAELVGPGGRVLGVDENPRILETATPTSPSLPTTCETSPPTAPSTLWSAG
jgi:ubiquinone/menaquinone biosynthesis C-methylase UbiE